MKCNTQSNDSLVLPTVVYAECLKLALMLSVVTLNVVMLSVGAPVHKDKKVQEYSKTCKTIKITIISILCEQKNLKKE
jgi:hypothetical protein